MHIRLLRSALLALLLLTLSLPGLAQATITDFSFVQISDVHSARSDSASTIATLMNIGAIDMAPYHVTAPAPSFLIATGDVTEFGVGYGKAFDAFLSYIKPLNIPFYICPGNHDGTWDNIRPEIRKLSGNAYYSFDRNGCHFIMLDSTGLQDPRPNFTVEELKWLSEDLKKITPATPVIIGFHHPLPAGEAASPYDFDRLMDIIHPYNVIAMLVGHGHNAVYSRYEGIDQIEGGSTFGNPGYNIFDFQSGMMRVAYKRMDEKTPWKPLLEKKITTSSSYPTITIYSPDSTKLASGLGDLSTPSLQRVIRAMASVATNVPAKKMTATATVAKLARGKSGAFAVALEKEFRAPLGDSARALIAKGTLGSIAKAMDKTIQSGFSQQINISAGIEGAPAQIQSASYEIDGELKGDLALEGAVYRATVSTEKLIPGAHYLRIFFKADNGQTYRKSTQFYVENGKTYARWRVALGGSSKSTPTIADGVVYVGAFDGKLYAIDARSGAPKWSYTTGGEILGQALVANKTVYVGSLDSKLYAVDAATGKLKWSFEAEKPIAGSPVFADGKVLFGCNSGAFYAVDAVSGKQAWVNQDATYTVEIKPFVKGTTVYYGAWDSFVYAVNIADGKLVWKSVSAGADRSAGRYYSPADCGPVAAGDRVFCADRNSVFTIFNQADGARVSSVPQCSGTGVAEDGSAVYLRRTNGDLMKAKMDGQQIWAAPINMGYVPATPIEKDGVVYASSGTGLVSAVSSTDGAIRWQYQASPQLWVMSSVTASNGTAYVSGIDGTLTAISSR